MNTATYLVPECNLSELESRIEKLNHKAVKLNVTPIKFAKTPDHVRYEVAQLTVDGMMNRSWRTSIEKVENPGAAYLANAFTPTGNVMSWWKVTVEGETPRYNGWEFVATLEPLATDDGKVLNLVQTVPGSDCPKEYRDKINVCDHCNINRMRKQTFVLKHESGEFKSVGRQCLKNFLGFNGDPHEFAALAEMLGELSSLCEMAEDEEGFGGGRFRERAWDLCYFLTWVASRIDKFGWMSRSAARKNDRATATADVVLALLTPPSHHDSEKDKQEWKDTVAKHEPEEKNKVQAEAAIEWAKNLPEKELEGSNYLANVNLISRVGTVDRKTAGIAASIITAYKKAKDEEIKREQFANHAPSVHVGVIGKRCEMIVTCERKFSSEGQWGETIIHKLVDDKGNDLTWFASGNSKVLEEGKTYKVKLTPKAHQEYKGRPQTVVNRVVIIEKMSAVEA